MLKKSLVPAIVPMSTISGSVNAATVGYWRFEEGVADSQLSGASSVTDETANNNHGSPVGNPFYRGDVPVGSIPLTGAANNTSAEFDGSDYVAIPDSGSLNVTTQFTIEFWMKGNPTQSQTQYLVVDKSHGFVDQTGWFFQGLSSTGTISFGLGTNSGFPFVQTAASVLDNTWRHIAGTYDSSNVGQELNLFVDGILEATGAAGTYNANTRNINIGAALGSGNPVRFFNGSVDELRISDTVLAPSEFLVSAVPIPMAAPLMLSGLMALGFVGRKSRKVLA